MFGPRHATSYQLHRDQVAIHISSRPRRDVGDREIDNCCLRIGMSSEQLTGGN